MAFDLHRALSLGRRTARLIGALRDDARPRRAASEAGRRAGERSGPSPFPGPPGPPGPAWDPTEPTDSWPMPGPGQERRPRRQDTDRHVSLPDFTGTVRVEYAPAPGPTAGPGEVVWTWVPVSYTHLTLPTIAAECRSRWSPYH